MDKSVEFDRSCPTVYFEHFFKYVANVRNKCSLSGVVNCSFPDHAFGDTGQMRRCHIMASYRKHANRICCVPYVLTYIHTYIERSLSIHISFLLGPKLNTIIKQKTINVQLP